MFSQLPSCPPFYLSIHSFVQNIGESDDNDDHSHNVMVIIIVVVIVVVNDNNDLISNIFI